MAPGPKQAKYFIKPGQKWEVDLFRPEDAQGVADLFISVYGDGYPIRTYTDPKRLAEENAAANTLSSVARTPTGDIVGHNALYRSAPHSGIYETGAGLVHRDYRGGKGISTDLVAHGMEVAAGKYGVEGIFGECVCNHIFMQKICDKLGLSTQAAEVDLMPASAYTTEKSARGRVSSLLVFKTLIAKPHTVYLPSVYEEALGFIYDGLEDKRDIRVAKDSFPRGSLTRIQTQVFDFARVARIAVDETGADFEEAFSKAEKKAERQGVTVFQAWLNLSHPWVGGAVDFLRPRGYFMGGILPRWFDHDGLLMMKMRHRPHWEDMQVHFDRAKEIVRRVRADWEAVDSTHSVEA